MIRLMSTKLRVLFLSSPNPDADLAEQVAEILTRGDLVAAPTETRYGLLARADRSECLERLVIAKRRPANMATAVFARDRKEIFSLGTSTKTAEILVDKFLPGPLTLVLRNRVNLPAPVVVNERIGVRWSSDDFIRRLTSLVSFPITATSANISGQEGEGDPEQIARRLGEHLSAIVNAGRLSGPPSTVIDCSEEVPVILRSGAIDVKVIEELTGISVKWPKRNHS